MKHGTIAIISYRCERVSSDAFTLDAFAFLSAVAAARQHGIAYLWLDAWAYRQQPPWATYRHEHFCECLAEVMLLVDRVIWLPVSRLTGLGTYQFRSRTGT
eukprot:3096417-Prymnesium_polylepis.2